LPALRRCASLRPGGLFCLFCLQALSFNRRGFFAFRPGFRFLLLACRTLFRFDALAFRQLSTRFLFSFTARCGFNLRFVLRFGIAAGLFCRFRLMRSSCSR
jgi:hypothetical protein